MKTIILVLSLTLVACGGHGESTNPVDADGARRDEAGRVLFPFESRLTAPTQDTRLKLTTVWLEVDNTEVAVWPPVRPAECAQFESNTSPYPELQGSYAIDFRVNGTSPTRVGSGYSLPGVGTYQIFELTAAARKYMTASGRVYLARFIGTDCYALLTEE